jgi:hypothetical protein
VADFYVRKLTPTAVAQVRGSREAARVIARRFGVSHQTISKIRTGKTWRPRPPDEDDWRVHDLFTAWPRKLTTRAVESIRESDEPGVVLAARYGVSPSMVSAIRHRRVWDWCWC